MSNTLAKKEPDGRRARSERSREAIMHSMLELIEEGILVPTAQQVSDRAEVGIRTVFRHFDDMESMFDTLNKRIRVEDSGIITGGDRSGSLEVRIKKAIERRATIYKKRRNIFLFTEVQLWKYEKLKAQYEEMQILLQKDFEDMVPEVKSLVKRHQSVVFAMTSFDMWTRLRRYEHEEREDVVEIMFEQVMHLFKG